MKKIYLVSIGCALISLSQTKPEQTLENFYNFEPSICIEHEAAKEILITSLENIPITRSSAKKPWTFIVYIAADNDLRAFVVNNLKQMASIGSNQNINIVAHMDIRLNGNEKVTRRYLVEKNKLTQMNVNDPKTQRMDSGDPKTLISCCEWAINNYPAEHYALIMWNHGTGILDPDRYKIINPSELFIFNSETNRLELDRSIGFLELINCADLNDKGICWDNTTGNFLSNKKLELALNEVCSRLLGGKKIDIIGFDACLMSMIEVASMLKKYAYIMVGSQEVELGTGWDYSRILAPFNAGSLNPTSFATHIVNEYRNAYHKITHDYTQSALNLSKIKSLEDNVSHVAQILVECLKKQRNNGVKKVLQQCRNKKNCTHFDEPSYIDLHHLYTNINNSLATFDMADKSNMCNKLRNTVQQGVALIEQAVIANTAGKKLANARGISIYFPEKRIHRSYPDSLFAQQTSWTSLLNHYLK